MVRRRGLSPFGHVARIPDNAPANAGLRLACDIRDGVPPFPNWRRPWPGSSSHYLAAPFRFVQTVTCQLETPSTVPRIGPCGEHTLRPPRLCVDDDDDMPFH